MKTPEEIKKGLECCSNGDCDNCPYWERKLDCGDYLKADTIALIEQLEAAQPKWISVKDALPDRQCEYLIRYGFGEPIIQSYSGVMYFVLYDERPHFENDGLYGLKVTHWMPLPEAPKED